MCNLKTSGLKRGRNKGELKEAGKRIAVSFLSLAAATVLLTSDVWAAPGAGAGLVLESIGSGSNAEAGSQQNGGSQQNTGGGETVVSAEKSPAESTAPVRNVEATSQSGSGQNAQGSGQNTASSQSSSQQKTEKETLEEIKKEARLEITGYGDIKKLKADQTTCDKIDAIVKKYNKLIGTAKGDENQKGLSGENSVEDCVTAAKDAIDALVSSDRDTDTDDGNHQPTSTSDFVMVGGNWVTPVVSYGQYVNVVLPVVNMSGVNLANVTVTPVVSNSVQEWPFELETSSYTQTIPDLPGKGNGQNDMDRRRELTWTFKTRVDALSGYYKLTFNVLYANDGETESATLTTYVKVLGAPGSGSAESEGGGLSTPRVIVTGFETDPATVHAGETFLLTLHLKNTSMRTAVSNMLVNFSAPNEGTDTDSSYAAFLPTTGSNSSYISSIGKGQTVDLVIEMTAKADLSQKPYPLDVSLEYEDEDYAAFTANADVSIPVYQDARFELGKPEILPEEIEVDGEANIMFSIYNLGKVNLYNVKVNFEGDSIEGGDTFLGKLEAGGTGNVDAMITGAAPTKEGEKDYIVVTYEDEAGHQQTYKEELALKVTGDPDAMREGEEPFQGSYNGEIEGIYGDEEFEDVDVEEGLGGKGRLFKILGIIAGALILLVIVILLVGRLRKKKQEKEDLSLLEEEEELEEERPAKRGKKKPGRQKAGKSEEPEEEADTEDEGDEV